MSVSNPVPNVLATRYASAELVELWSPEYKIVLERRLWIAVLRAAYGATGVGPGFFAVDLIHPVADLVVLGGTLWLALRAGRRGLTLYAAVFVGAIGDFLAVQARASGVHPGAWPELAWLAAIGLMGSIGVVPTAQTDRAVTSPADTGPVSAAW